MSKITIEEDKLREILWDGFEGNITDQDEDTRCIDQHDFSKAVEQIVSDLEKKGEASQLGEDWISVEDRLPEVSGMRVIIVNIGIPDNHEKFSTKTSDFIRGRFYHNGSVYTPSHWHKAPSIEMIKPPKGAQ